MSSFAGVADPPPKPAPDLRWLMAAAGSWSGVLLAGRLPAAACWWLAIAALSLTLFGWRLGATIRRIAAVGLIMFAAGVVISVVGRQSRLSGPVASLARGSGSAQAEVVISGDPKPLPRQPHLAAGVAVPASIRLLERGGQRWRARLPVLVLAPAASWGRLLPSTRVRGFAEFAASRQGDLAAVLLIRGPPVVVGHPSAIQRWAGRVRAGLRRAVSGLSPSERGLLPGLVLGDTGQMPPSDTASFRAAGLTHLTAVSGANLAMVVAAVVGLLRWTRFGIRLRVLASAISLIGFVVLARPSPSVLRAAVMGLLALGAVALGRPRLLLPAALVSVTGLVLFDPGLAGQPGFALSVIATLALIVVAPGWAAALRARLPPRFGPLAPAIAAALTAQVACAPVIAAISGGVSLASLPANVLALPAVPPATVLGLAAALISLVAPSVAALLCQVAAIACWWIVRVARVAAALPTADLTAPSGGWGLLVVLAVDVAAVLAARTRPGRRTIALAVAALTLASLAVKA